MAKVELIDILHQFRPLEEIVCLRVAFNSGCRLHGVGCEVRAVLLDQFSDAMPRPVIRLPDRRILVAMDHDDLELHHLSILASVASPLILPGLVQEDLHCTLHLFALHLETARWGGHRGHLPVLRELYLDMGVVDHIVLRSAADAELVDGAAGWASVSRHARHGHADRHCGPAGTALNLHRQGSRLYDLRSFPARCRAATPNGDGCGRTER
mmetsp:Transcript_90917/g.190104  ORF Transcript_90917/g.190104 Transcript_90917/m.190104 type:complete len:211 (+) Transcript_90917:578-1210(+)